MNVSKTIIRFKNVATQKSLKRRLFFGDSQTFFLSCFPDGKKSTFSCKKSCLIEQLVVLVRGGGGGGGDGGSGCHCGTSSIPSTLAFFVEWSKKVKKKFWMNRLFVFFQRVSVCLSTNSVKTAIFFLNLLNSWLSM